MRTVFIAFLLLFPSVLLAQTQIPDDCNFNQVSDLEELLSTSSSDCDRNGIPDECVGDGTNQTPSFQKLLQVEGTSSRYNFHIENIDDQDGLDLIAPAGSERFMLISDVSANNTPSPVFFSRASGDEDLHLGDFDNQNGPDVLTFSTHQMGPRLDINVHLNSGGGTFAAAQTVETSVSFSTNYSGLSLRVADFSGDGIDDILHSDVDEVSSDGEIVLLTSAGDGVNFNRSEVCAPTAQMVGANANARTFAEADFDQDGDLDFVAYWEGEGVAWFSVCVNQGGGVFAQGEIALIEGFDDEDMGLQVIDINGDEDADIIYRPALSSFDNAEIRYGANGATFAEPEIYADLRGSDPIKRVFADLNNDSRLDIAYVTSQRSIEFYRGRSNPLDNSRYIRLDVPEEDQSPPVELVGSLFSLKLAKNEEGEPFEMFALGKPSTENRIALFKITEAPEFEEPVPALPSRCASGNRRFSTYGYWNTYVGMTSIVALLNPRFEESLQLIVRDASGQTLSDSEIIVAPRTQFDVIINDLEGVPVDSYGSYEVRTIGTSSDDINTVFYRSSTPESIASASFDIGDYDFATPVYAGRILRGTSSVAANTFQPSRDAIESEAPVYQWLSLTNISSSTERFSVKTYGTDGVLLLERSLTLSPYQRLDIEGGHESLGANRLALHEITPEREQIPYLAGLMRYGTSAGGRFSFANWYPASIPNEKNVFLPVSSAGGREQWLEIANPRSEAITLRVQVYDSSGNLQSSRLIELGAFKHQHLQLSADLPPNDYGLALIEPRGETSTPLLYSSSYFRDLATGGIETAFRSFLYDEDQLRRTTSSYNRFLGMSNYLHLSNATRSTGQNLELTAFGTRGPEQARVEIGNLESNLTPYQSRVFDIGGNMSLGTNADSYGELNLRVTYGQGSSSSSFADRFGELLRFRQTASGNLDFAYVLRLAQ